MVDKVEIKQAETTSDKPEEAAKTEAPKEEAPKVEVQEQPKEKILGKFETQEDLIKSYQELEKKIGEKQETKTETKSEDKDKGLEIDQAAEKAVASAGLDMTALQNEYDTTGEVSKESMEKLAKAGISEDVVERYIQGQQALATNIETDIKSVVGGNEAYKQMMDWAKENLTQEEIQAYNTTVNTQDVATVKLAVSGLKARMGNNSEPTFVQGKTGTGPAAFESWAQVTQAMADPRYSKDPAYQKEVSDKLRRSELK